MRSLFRRYVKDDDKGAVALIILFGLAYLTIFTGSARPFTLGEIAGLTVLGLFYLFFGLEGLAYCLDHPQTLPLLIFFGIELPLVVVIQLLCHSAGAFWLLYLPVVSFAVVLLPRAWMLAICAIVLVAFALPVYLQSGDLGFTWQSLLSYASAVAFVVVFNQISLNERQARAALNQANLKLREYASQAEELATTKERNRLAREIHDSLGHYLTVINVQIGAARAVIETDQPRALDALQKAQSLTREGLTEVRRSVGALRASPLANRSLSEALAALVEESRTAGIVTHLDIVGTPRLLAPQTELTMYRAAQEGLTNVRKHACASRVDLTLEYGAASVRLKLADNGVGKTDSATGFGLLGVRERVQLLGGDVQTKTAPGQGFVLEVELPL